MPDRSPFDYPFHEQPTDDPVTGPAARCNDPLQADSRQRPSLEYPLDVPEVKPSWFFTRICAIGQVALRGARSVVSAATRPWSRHTHQH
mgnify:FL=1